MGGFGIPESLAGMLLILSIYLLPTIITIYRKHLNSTAIAALNLLIGWTVVGWFAAFIWSLTSNTGTKENPGNQTPAVVMVVGIFGLLSFATTMNKLSDGSGTPETSQASIESPIGRWVQMTETDPITDEQLHVIVLEHDNDSIFDNPAIYAGCKDNQTALSIDWDEYFYSSPEVTTRVGSDEPATLEWALLQSTTNTRYPGDAANFLAYMMTANTFTVRTTAPGAGQVTITFDITGLPEAIKPIREACNW